MIRVRRKSELRHIRYNRSEVMKLRLVSSLLYFGFTLSEVHRITGFRMGWLNSASFSWRVYELYNEVEKSLNDSPFLQELVAGAQDAVKTLRSLMNDPDVNASVRHRAAVDMLEHIPGGMLARQRPVGSVEVPEGGFVLDLGCETSRIRGKLESQ